MNVVHSSLDKIDRRTLPKSAELIERLRRASIGNTNRRIHHKTIDGMEHKWCCGCRSFLPVTVFFNNRSKWDGLSIQCKDCTQADIKKRLEANPEEARRLQRNWRAKNPEKLKAKARKSAAARRLDPKQRLNAAVRAGVYSSLLGKKRCRSWQVLVGYTVTDLQRHLERKFKPGMTWSNYGHGWHVDHIIPISAFNFSDPKHIDFKRCWALSNLQPLWAMENMSKGDKCPVFQPALAI